jgi:AcrR family transcriptional regulator
VARRKRAEDKRNAILDAATQLFAERGLAAAPTSEISRRAGIAEGTLFAYFKTKEDVIDSLYRGIKLGLAEAMMSDFPPEEFAPGCNMFGIAIRIGALRIPNNARYWQN